MTVELHPAMARAFEEAEAAGDRGEVPVGACVTAPDGSIMASAGNRTRELNDPTAHAEVLVIREAGRLLDSERLTGCDIHVTLEPCAMCAAAVSFARQNLARLQSFQIRNRSTQKPRSTFESRGRFTERRRTATARG